MLIKRLPFTKTTILSVMMLLFLGINDQAYSGKWRRMMRRQKMSAPKPTMQVPVPRPAVVPATPKSFFVEFHNKYKKSIYTAVTFRDSEGKWVTEGWYLLKADQKIKVAITNNLIVYSYAESEAPLDSRIFWDGRSQPKESPNLKIRDSKNKYSFRLHDFSDKRLDNTLTIPFVFK